jgi:hypothetical protein
MEGLSESRGTDGAVALHQTSAGSLGFEPDAIVELDGEKMYRIARYDAMPPFLMSLVSDTDLWMYVSSYGPVTAGRIDEEHCLFPYVTDDQLHKAVGQTGPVTTLRVRRGSDHAQVWEPFLRFPAPEGIERNLYKSLLSNRITFEEINRNLNLTIRATWTPCDRFGFVRSVVLENDDRAMSAEIEILDGLVNILPAGVSLAIMQRFSCLVDAYTRCEIDAETGLALFSLSSQITDRAEPAESLVANILWSRGLPGARYLLSQDQTPNFRQGQPLQNEELLTGRRGAFLVSATVALEPGDRASWDTAADVNRDQAQVESLRAFLRDERDPRARLQEAVEDGRDSLTRCVAMADGVQATADTSAAWHQAACVLFNNMRGGIFAHGYQISRSDFAVFVAAHNKDLARAQAAFLQKLPETVSSGDLIAAVKESGNANLVRLALEYLPLTFSRRHGDPSRPWNHFSIRVKNPDGSQILDYEGNWRDIFQNWEALCVSFPGFLESIIAKFVNASTIDGFNPYRVTRSGIEWETPRPEDPWSSIGYWGDHQIIYLLKFLEASRSYHPGVLDRMLAEPSYSYADVPYHIKPYADILRDSRNTIVFDEARHFRIMARASTIGADGKLVVGPDREVYHAPLIEKLLVSALAKLSNLVLDGGIWMNTQRPEWNDANNALVGNGISMVTLCYLRRYLAFCRDLFANNEEQLAQISAEVADWMNGVQETFAQFTGVLALPEVTDQDRRKLLDSLGEAFSSYRSKVYKNGFSGTVKVSVTACRDLCDAALPYLDHSIRANRREDGLYHAYNLLDVSAPGNARVHRMYEMLEGQVAVLSAGVLSADETASLLQSLFASRLYRTDQESFLLYPARKLPGFLEKNIVSADRVSSNPLLTALLDSGDSAIVLRDTGGHYRFNARFRNAADLNTALDRLASEPSDWSRLVASHRQDVLDIYEQVFDHRSFTGRSGTMYGYEGLGCIYWHMVSKLLVAVGECHRKAEKNGASADTVQTLADQYYRIREGMGFSKSAHEFGAFPADPYSHTPAHAGARQPGMTGQSKEDILARWGELGIIVQEGCLRFHPTLLRKREFFSEPQSLSYFNLKGRPQTLDLPANSLAFTLCQTPIIYKRSDAPVLIVIHRTAGKPETIPGDRLTRETSSEIFNRTGTITQVEVSLPKSLFALN